MEHSDAREDRDALVRIRTQLTVALLAVAQLCRRLGALPPVERLCGLAKDALLRVRDEVAGIETRLRRRASSPEQAAGGAEEHPPAS